MARILTGDTMVFMELLLVPLIGPFHLRSPTYNSVTVVDLLRSLEPDALLTSALSETDLLAPGWQDAGEVALPLAIEPWARRTGVPLVGIGSRIEDPNSEEDFRRYLATYAEGRRLIDRLDALLARVRAELEEPLTLARIRDRLVIALREYQYAREEEFGDGPASGWLRQRVNEVVGRLPPSATGRTALLAPAEQLPILTELLDARGVRWRYPEEVPASAKAQERALLDYALRMEAEEPEPLLARLKAVPGSESRYHQANLLLAMGRGPEALAMLEETSRGDFAEPYFLPGYLLTRLGQLRDLAGRREAARGAYRAVLALDYAPPEAREEAARGLETPFR